ncbi:MAG: hypothetical protein AAFU64_06825, partial [Bacteroidota bacterium]
MAFSSLSTLQAQDTDPCFQLTLSSQAEVDAFDCEEVRNRLTISGNDIRDLSPLQKLSNFQGVLIINNNPHLINLKGLENLRSLTRIIISNNPELESLEGLNGLIFSQNLEISLCPKLRDLKGINALVRAGSLTISRLSSLENLQGLEGLVEVDFLSVLDNPQLNSLVGLERVREMLYLTCWNNDLLEDFQALERLSSDTLSLSIRDNENLKSLKGLESIRVAQFSINLENNPQLTDISALSQVHTCNTELKLARLPLIDLKGLSNLKFVTSTLSLRSLPLLKNLNGLDSLEQIGNPPFSTRLGSLVIHGNPELQDISALQQVKVIADDIFVEQNPKLSDCCLLLDLDRISSGSLITSGNGANCSSGAKLQMLCGPLVERFVLVNAETGEDVQVLEEGSSIPFSETPWSIRAESGDERTQSITLRLTGPKSHFQLENVEPFSLFGDNGPQDYQGEIFSSGNYEIFAQIYSEKRGQGFPGEIKRLKFTVEANDPQITRLELFEPDERTGAFRTVLNDGDRINIEDLTDGFPFFTIQALTNPGQIGSVYFSLQGPINIEQTENRIPYVIFGDIKNMDFNSNRDFDFNSQQLLPGAYTLRVTPYSLPNRQGVAGETQVIRFVAFVPGSGLLVSPNPSEGPIQIKTSQAGLLQVYNPRGEQIYQQEFDQAIDIDLDLENREG